MTYLVVELRTVTATFRNPEFQNFHKTLHLPPPTTLVGLAGAALGLSPKAAQAEFEKGDWEIGISGTSEGYAKDLWKYQSSWKSETGWDRSIVHREILFDNHFLAVFGSADETNVRILKAAFESPKYALTLGSSDSLAKLVSVEIIEETAKNSQLSNCLAAGNVLSAVKENIQNGLEFSIYNSSEPIAGDLPTRFQYESDYGVRRVTHRKTCSFIGERMMLNFAVKGIWAKGQFVPVFPLHDAPLPEKSSGQTTLLLD